MPFIMEPTPPLVQESEKPDEYLAEAIGTIGVEDATGGGEPATSSNACKLQRASVFALPSKCKKNVADT